MSKKITPAVKTALAYLRVTGNMPSHLHARTYCAAILLTERVPYMLGDIELHRDVLTDLAKAATENHSLWLAHKYLTARGFRVATNMSYRNTSHYVAYTHAEDDDLSATSYRHGGCGITRALRDADGKFIRNERTSLTLADTKA